MFKMQSLNDSLLSECYTEGDPIGHGLLAKFLLTTDYTVRHAYYSLD